MAGITSALCRDRHVGDVSGSGVEGRCSLESSGTIMTVEGLLGRICRYDTFGPAELKPGGHVRVVPES